jgi:hypothetical protein
MSGAIHPLPQYAFMTWCLVKAQGQLYLYLTYPSPSGWRNFLCYSIVRNVQKRMFVLFGRKKCKDEEEEKAKENIRFVVPLTVLSSLDCVAILNSDIWRITSVNGPVM